MIDNIEVIVVNDNSTDNSLNIINEYSNDYPNFKVSYNRDINGAFEEIKNAIISLGGNV